MCLSCDDGGRIGCCGSCGIFCLGWNTNAIVALFWYSDISPYIIWDRSFSVFMDFLNLRFQLSPASEPLLHPLSFSAFLFLGFKFRFFQQRLVLRCLLPLDELILMVRTESKKLSARVPALIHIRVTTSCKGYSEHVGSFISAFWRRISRRATILVNFNLVTRCILKIFSKTMRIGTYVPHHCLESSILWGYAFKKILNPLGLI